MVWSGFRKICSGKDSYFAYSDEWFTTYIDVKCGHYLSTIFTSASLNIDRTVTNDEFGPFDSTHFRSMLRLFSLFSKVISLRSLKFIYHCKFLMILVFSCM